MRRLLDDLSIWTIVGCGVFVFIAVTTWVLVIEPRNERKPR